MRYMPGTSQIACIDRTAIMAARTTPEGMVVDVACGGRGPEYHIGDGKYWHRARCIDNCGRRYPASRFIPLRELNMPSSDAFALRHSGLNEFLFAPVGTEANGMTLSVVSVFARLGNDPWQEAGRLAGLPKPEAIESLARIIASMPTSVWPLQAATTIATRLIALLPTQAGNLGQSPQVSAYGTKVGGIIRIGLVLAAVAFAVAFQTGVITTFGAPEPDGNSVAGFAVAPR
jgi:hypothetical protein